MTKAPRGRPGRYAEYQKLEAGLPAKMTKRPQYVNGIGLFRGERGTTAWLKINLRRGGVFRGRSYGPGQSVEIKLGSRDSWTWEALETERSRLQGLADRGEPLEDVRGVLFADHAQAWLERKKATARGYDILAGHVRKHLSPSFGHKALTDITLADVNRWIAKQLDVNKPATVHRQLSTFKAILNDAAKHGLLRDSPTDHADAIKGIEGRKRILSEPELRVVLEAADRFETEAADRPDGQEIKGWLRNFLLWAIHSGMRRQEILNLRLSNFREGADDQTYVIVEHSKSGQPRIVACSEDMLKLRDTMAAFSRAEGDDRLFPLSLTTAKRKLTRLWKSCGLEDVRLHDLRRTHASRLISAGADVRTVASRLGHSDLSMLERHYAVSLGDMDAAKKTQAMFGGLL